MLPIFIQHEARLQPNIGFTSQHVSMVFTYSAITSPKLNRFEWNLEHSEHIVWGWSHMGRHIGATWRVRLNLLSAMVMRSYVNITLTTCFMLQVQR